VCKVVINCLIKCCYTIFYAFLSWLSIVVGDTRSKKVLASWHRSHIVL
jgi:hypothetical protein